MGGAVTPPTVFVSTRWAPDTRIKLNKKSHFLCSGIFLCLFWNPITSQTGAGSVVRVQATGHELTLNYNCNNHGQTEVQPHSQSTC